MTSDCLSGDLRPFLEGERPMQDLEAYYERDRSPSGYRFSGAAFDTFGRDDEDPDRFSAEDLVALSFLAVPVRGHAALAILETQASELNVLLAQIPADVDMWEVAPEVIGPDSAAAELWTRLHGLPDLGWVSVNKLLARKRPRLLPVYDNVVKAALQKDEDAYWLPLHAELQDPSLRQRLAEIRRLAGQPDTLPLLRVLDVVVWMRNGPESGDPLPFTPCPGR